MVGYVAWLILYFEPSVKTHGMRPEVFIGPGYIAVVALPACLLWCVERHIVSPLTPQVRMVGQSHALGRSVYCDECVHAAPAHKADLGSAFRSRCRASPAALDLLTLLQFLAFMSGLNYLAVGFFPVVRRAR